MQQKRRPYFPIRGLLIALLVLPLSNCFQILHFIDIAEDGTAEIQWSFRFSKALDDMKKKDGNETGLSDEVSKGQKETSEKMKDLVKNMKVEQLQSDYDSGVRLSFQVPNLAKIDRTKLQGEEFPLIPEYDLKAKQIRFRFLPMKKDDKKTDPKNSKPAMKPAPKDGENSETPEKSENPEGGMDQMGQQFSKLFLSSVRYQIVLGKNIKIASVITKQGAIEKKVDFQALGEQTLIDLPLFALFGDKEQPFDLILKLK